MIDYEDFLKKGDDSYPLDPNLLAPVIVAPAPIIDNANDNAGVKIKIPASTSKNLKAPQTCLLFLKANKDDPIGRAANIECDPNDSLSFTIENGAEDTIIKSAPGAFAKAMANFSMGNGTAYLFYGLYPQGILSELGEVKLEFKNDL